MMEKRELKIDYAVWKNSFPEEYEKLCQEAVNASEKAYSIYSNFSVGAAVLLEDDEIVTGNNQENIAYPNGLCAERVALFYAGAIYPEKSVKALAIAASSDGHLREVFVSPCGACRQVMAEVIKRYEQDFDVILVGKKETVVLKASQLLPFVFSI